AELVDALAHGRNAAPLPLVECGLDERRHSRAERERVLRDSKGQRAMEVVIDGLAVLGGVPYRTDHAEPLVTEPRRFGAERHRSEPWGERDLLDAAPKAVPELPPLPDRVARPRDGEVTV